MKSNIRGVLIGIWIGTFAMLGAHAIDDINHNIKPFTEYDELSKCNKSNIDYKALTAYQQMDTTNKKTIKLLYDINSNIHHKYDSLLNVKQ